MKTIFLLISLILLACPAFAEVHYLAGSATDEALAGLSTNVTNLNTSNMTIHGTVSAHLLDRLDAVNDEVKVSINQTANANKFWLGGSDTELNINNSVGDGVYGRFGTHARADLENVINNSITNKFEMNGSAILTGTPASNLVTLAGAVSNNKVQVQGGANLNTSITYPSPGNLPYGATQFNLTNTSTHATLNTLEIPGLANKVAYMSTMTIIRRVSAVPATGMNVTVRCGTDSLPDATDAIGYNDTVLAGAAIGASIVYPWNPHYQGRVNEDILIKAEGPSTISASGYYVPV